MYVRVHVRTYIHVYVQYVHFTFVIILHTYDTQAVSAIPVLCVWFTVSGAQCELPLMETTPGPVMVRLFLGGPRCQR